MRDKSKIRLVKFETICVGEAFYINNVVWERINMTSARCVETNTVCQFTGIPSKAFVFALDDVKYRDAGLYGKICGNGDDISDKSLLSLLPKGDVTIYLNQMVLDWSCGRDENCTYTESVEQYGVLAIAKIHSNIREAIAQIGAFANRRLMAVAVKICGEERLKAKTMSEFYANSQYRIWEELNRLGIQSL